MSSEEKERNMKEQREKEKTTVPHECTQSRSVAVRFLDPSLLRSPVRASFAMLRSDKHPPLDPSSPLSVNPSVPLSKSTERSLTRAARRAQPPLRPHRDLTAVVNAERERESKEDLIDVFVSPHTVVPRLTLWLLRTSPSHASPISPSSLLRRLLHLLLLLYRPTSGYCGSQTSCRNSYSRFHCLRRTAVVKRTEGRTVGLHSRRIGSLLRDSRQPAAVVLFPQQRVSVMLLVFLAHLFSISFHSISSLSLHLCLNREREREREITRASCILLCQLGIIARIYRMSLSPMCILIPQF